MAIGARNPRLRRLRRLTGRSKARSEERAFVVDGPTLVGEALRSGMRVVEVFAGPGVLAEAGLVDLIGPEVEVFEVEPSVLEPLLDPVNPRPLAAVVAMADEADGLPAGLAGGTAPILVAVELRDPGNLGTILRTAEASGMAGLVLAGPSVDRFAPKVVRASAGSLFRLPVVARADALAALDELAATGRPVVAAVVDAGAVAYERADLSSAVIVVGNEANGLAAEVVARADLAVTIPMAPGVESLNAAVAASVLCFEAARQRRLSPAGGGAKSDGQAPIRGPVWPQ
jgi:TrmH family RNA methyltransferase